MRTRFSTIRPFLATLWQTDRILVATATAMLGVFLASLIGLVTDPRTIGGAPAWLKPAKFGVSTAIYSVTLAWVFTWLPAWPRLRRRVSLVTAGVFVLEVAIIAVQAGRGTASHFNVNTPLDAALFSVMGASIAVQTLAAVFVAVALVRQPFADRVMGVALRAGMIVSLAGAATGGLMTRPTEAQLLEARTTHHMTMAGAHTVGAPDGGAGLPGTGWSREHGDLRVPHFVGLHAMQILPLLALLIRRRPELTRPRLVAVAATSYASLFVLLLFEALRGEPLVSPGETTARLLIAWSVVTLLAVWAAGRRWSRVPPMGSTLRV